MARGGGIRNTRKRVRMANKGSDESDEDYNVGDDEELDDSEDENYSLAEDDSEESLDEFVEDEEDEEFMVPKFKKARQPRCRRGLQRKKNRVANSTKKRFSYAEEEEEDYDEDGIDDLKLTNGKKVSYSLEEDGKDCDNDFGTTTRRKKKTKSHEGDDDVRVSHRKDGFDGVKPIKKTKASYREREEDEEKEEDADAATGDDDDDLEDSDDDDSFDDDEEFTPDDIEGLDDDEDSPINKRNKVGRPQLREKQVAKRQKQKRKRKAKVGKNTKPKKPVMTRGSKRKTRSNHSKDVIHDKPTIRGKKRRIKRQGAARRSMTAESSDSDFVSSGSSDYEYTISEEEREQVREANEFCRDLATSLRTSNSLNETEQVEVLPPQRKRAGKRALSPEQKETERKGKEKMENLKVENLETGKQVCGICLSEEGKRTIRGTLNSCSHFFCFACIMEWSKVESRCPICKQRFATVTKSARAQSGFDLRAMVISVPERDQVYQPSEEELRGYLDPYESVMCSECQQGGDDALMLLCDLCDSPAHTYCVGLGYEVPEGNWYCNSCRPTALASSDAQGPHPTIDGGNNNLGLGSSPAANVRETFDLNELYVPETPLTPRIGNFHSPRHSAADSQAVSPSWPGALTVLGRRRIQHQIHQILNSRSRLPDRTLGGIPLSGNSLFGSQVARGRQLAPQHSVAPERTSPQNIYSEGRRPNYAMPFSQNRETFSPRLSSLREQVLHNQASTSRDHSLGGMPQGECDEVGTAITSGLDQQPLTQCNSSRLNVTPDLNMSPYQFRETRLPSSTLQGGLHQGL